MHSEQSYTRARGIRDTAEAPHDLRSADTSISSGTSGIDITRALLAGAKGELEATSELGISWDFVSRVF